MSTVSRITDKLEKKFGNRVNERLSELMSKSSLSECEVIEVKQLMTTLKPPQQTNNNPKKLTSQKSNMMDIEDAQNIILPNSEGEREEKTLNTKTRKRG